MSHFFWVLFMGVFSFVLCGLLRFAFVQYRHLDEPGERSSHHVATPTSGGLAFVVAFLAFYTIGPGFVLPGAYPWVIWFALVLIALVGIVDDYRELSPVLRLVVHFVSVGLVLLSASESSFQQYKEPLIFILALAVVIGAVWMLNLYNFMDGIDGIAGFQAVFFFGSIYFFLTKFYENSALTEFCLNLLVCVLGFLLWNFPKAKIFMGDGGSGFLGLSVFVVCVVSYWIDPILPTVCLILMGYFVVDSTCTLLVRFFLGENVMSAHCSHAYQKLARRLGSHVPVTVLVQVFNLSVLLPLAYFVINGQILWWTGLLVSYGLLCLFVLSMGSGRADSEKGGGR